jgi:hypothetical protein
VGPPVAAARSPRGAIVIALLLGAVFPGWGHIYLGRVRRFAVVALAYLAFAAALAWRGALSTFDGMVALLAAAALLWAFSAADAARLAASGTPPARRGRWPAYLAWWTGAICLWALWIAAREPLLGYGVFRMQTDSMSPAVNHREIVLVDTRAYRARLPVAGDVVVVREPATRARFLRRVSGIDAGGLALVPDRPGDGAGPSACRPEHVVGRATHVLWSRAPGRTGRPVS